MQLEFLWRTSRSFESELQTRIGSPLHVTVTNNSSSVLTYRPAREGNPARLRIHWMFLAADSEVLNALTVWMTKRRTPKSARIIDGFIKENEHLIDRRRTRRTIVATRGDYFDLRKLYDDVNKNEFSNQIDAPITWGRMPVSRRRRSIRLGSYTPGDNIIRIHPLLDQSFVPEYFVRYIVFHEMLHAHLGIDQTDSGRRCIHTPEFNRRERAYPDFARAIAWHDNPANLHRLLRAQPKAS